MKNVNWKVTGANWTWTCKAPEAASPVEIATQAFEHAWGTYTDKGTLKVSKGSKAALGAIVSIEHSGMESEEDHIFIYSPIVLANAGFHDDASALMNSLNQKYL